MSKNPPWLTVSGNSLVPGAAVLPVGKATCPWCQAESDGGDPEAWSVAISHADLVTWNADHAITFGITGTWEVDWTRVKITESGSAATCAAKITLTTGREGTLEFEFLPTVTAEKQGRLPIALKSAPGVLGDSGGTPDEEATGSVAITNHREGEALCGSTGCSAGDFGEFNGDTTGTISAGLVLGWAETVCRSGADEYRYTFTGTVVIPFSEGGVVKAYLYTGTWDEARFWWEPVPTEPEYTLEEEEAVGTVRGATIKARRVTYAQDHAASLVTGTAGVCPSPGYSSDVTTGETTGTISVTVAG